MKGDDASPVCNDSKVPVGFNECPGLGIHLSFVVIALLPHRNSVVWMCGMQGCLHEIAITVNYFD